MNAAVNGPIEAGIEFVESHRIKGQEAWAAVLGSVIRSLNSLRDSYSWVTEDELIYSRADFEVNDWHEICGGGGVWFEPITAMAYSEERAALETVSDDYNKRPSTERQRAYEAGDIVSDVQSAVDVMISGSIPILHRIAMRCGGQNLKEARTIQRWASELVKRAEECNSIIEEHGVSTRSEGWSDASESLSAVVGRLADIWRNPSGRLSTVRNDRTDDSVVVVRAPSGAVYPFTVAEYLRCSSDYRVSDRSLGASELCEAGSDEELAAALVRLPGIHVTLSWDDESLEGNYLR